LINADLIATFPVGIIQVNIHGKILFMNATCKEILKSYGKETLDGTIHNFLPSSSIIKVIKENNNEISVFENDKQRYYLYELPLIAGQSGLIMFIPENDFEKMINQNKKVMALKQELESIMNLSGELVTITDGAGKVLRVNATCEQIMGVKEQDFVGKEAGSLEINGVINLSSTIQVIKQKRPVTVSQTTKSGRRLLVRGFPIFDEEGHLSKVINISKDVTEEANLKKNLEETRKILSHFQDEFYNLQKRENHIVVKSKAMEEIYSLISRVAESDATVLLLGKTGVGKEVMARHIHQVSLRKQKPFIKINCGALPESLIESELFGYSKGTFTGANKEGKEGLLLAANNGTLFLDEIGELPLNLQSKLLQVLQEKEFTPLGQTKPVKINVRFIAATNRNLEDMIKQGQFRADLYYRLYVIPVTIPSLNERKEDIPFLVKHFLDLYNEKYHETKKIDNEGLQCFIDYEWEGNVRELQNTIERLVVIVPGNQISKHHLPPKIANTSHTRDDFQEEISLKAALAIYEKSILEKTLAKSSTLKEVSNKLSVDISTISRKCKKYKIDIAKMQM